MSKNAVRKVTKPVAKMVGGTTNLQFLTLALGTMLGVYAWTKNHPVMGTAVGVGTFYLAYQMGK